MRRKTLVAAAAALLCCAASVVALAALGEEPTNDALGVIKRLPPGSSCVCPANWDPVLCTAPDGTRQAFSNACVAGCYGYTHCAHIAIAP